MMVFPTSHSGVLPTFANLSPSSYSFTKMSSKHIIFLGTMSDRLPAVVFDEKTRSLTKTANNTVQQLPNWIIPHP